MSNFDTTDSSVFQTVTNFLDKMKKPGERFPSRDCTEDFYSMNNLTMGVAVIFNQIDFGLQKNLSNRDGTEKDANDLKNVLELFDFKVQIHSDCTTSEIKIILKRIYKEDHNNNNCVLIAMMTHGNKGGIVYTKDNQMKVNDIWKQFTAENCKSLAGKPKIFLFQACRGNLPDVGAEFEEPKMPDDEFCLRSSVNLSPNRFVIPTVSDILIYFSSAEGFPSFRDDNGSWFVQALCATLRDCYESKEETDIMTIFTRINRFIAFARQANSNDDLNACKQMPVIESMLTKRIVLNRKK